MLKNINCGFFCVFLLFVLLFCFFYFFNSLNNNHISVPATDHENSWVCCHGDIVLQINLFKHK